MNTVFFLRRQHVYLKKNISRVTEGIYKLHNCATVSISKYKNLS